MSNTTISNTTIPGHDAVSGIPLLARVWREDDVWNISAFDLPIVAYGEKIEDARAHFEEAVQSHFAALGALNRLDATAETLRALANQRSFYEERITPHTLVENFAVNLDELQAA